MDGNGWIITLPDGAGQVWVRFEGDVLQADWRAETWHSWMMVDQRMSGQSGSIEVAP